MDYTLKIASSLKSVDAQSWDALVDSHDPFTEHAFLKSLEDSGSVGSEQCGWLPQHLLLYQDQDLVGAMPTYLKFHSYGEYIFDWGWAQAAENAGIPYYPKLLCAVPFTPATGYRFLSAAPTRDRIREVLQEAALNLAHKSQTSGFHVLFCQEEESQNPQKPFFSRHTHQYHFTVDPTWHSFDDYLQSLRSRNRKQVKRERREALALGLEIKIKTGQDMSDEDFASLRRFYRATVQKKWAHAYLSEAFFEDLAGPLKHLVVASLAYENGRAVAGSLFFRKGDNLYGRYWGAEKEYPWLHFELCYYLPIQWCIEHGLRRFEAGAQGEHKIKRGFAPKKVYSLHSIAHPGLARAIQNHVEHEQQTIQSDIEYLENFTPFKAHD